MTLVNRWYRTIKLLVDHKGMSLQELRERLTVSPQTVRKNIDTLSDELVGTAQIIQKENLFQLEINNFEGLEEVLSGRLERESDFDSSGKRVSYIIKRLIEEGQFIPIYGLSEKLAVSHSIVNKDTKHVKEPIAPWQVATVGTPNRGVHLEGEEFDLHSLHVNYVQEHFKEQLFHETTK